MKSAPCLFHHHRNFSKPEQKKREFPPIMLFLRRRPMNNHSIWICFSRYLLHLHRHSYRLLLLYIRPPPVTTFPFHLRYLLPRRFRSSPWIPTIGCSSFAHRCSFPAFFVRRFLAYLDDSPTTSIIKARRSLAVALNRLSNHPYRNMTSHLSTILNALSSVSFSLFSVSSNKTKLLS